MIIVTTQILLDGFFATVTFPIQPKTLRS